MPSFLQQVESFLHYKSPKYVEVRSLNLGVLSKFLLLLIFLYIVVYQILYRNRHLGKSQPMGIARVQLQRPTKDHCNPNDADCEADYTPTSQLSYCISGDTVGGDGDRKPCRYLDEKQMNPTGFQHFAFMIPTRISTVRQRATGHCGPESTQKCTNVYVFNDSDKESVYVADVERFTLLIETAFTLPTEDQHMTPVRHGASNNFPGYWEVCADSVRKDCRLERIPCRGGGCDVGRRLSESSLNIFGLAFGDVISMGSLLSIAGVDLDRDTDSHGESRRSTGIALQIDVQYENRKPFNWPPWSTSEESIRYIYHASIVPFQTYKEVSEEVTADGSERLLVDKHGIFLNVNIRGTIAFFDLTTLLLILTTSLSLIAGANAGVHFFAAHIWRFRDEYKKERNDRSRNFDRDDKFCFCVPLAQFDNSPNQDWAYYSANPEEFTNDLRALDGDTLRCAGDLLMSLHRIQSRESGPDFVRKNRELWSRKSEDTTEPLMGDGD